jgi:hypothetical protein
MDEPDSGSDGYYESDGDYKPSSEDESESESAPDADIESGGDESDPGLDPAGFSQQQLQGQIHKLQNVCDSEEPLNDLIQHLKEHYGYGVTQLKKELSVWLEIASEKERGRVPALMSYFPLDAALMPRVALFNAITVRRAAALMDVDREIGYDHSDYKSGEEPSPIYATTESDCNMEGPDDEEKCKRALRALMPDASNAAVDSVYEKCDHAIEVDLVKAWDTANDNGEGVSIKNIERATALRIQKIYPRVLLPDHDDVHEVLQFTLNVVYPFTEDGGVFPMKHKQTCDVKAWAETIAYGLDKKGCHVLDIANEFMREEDLLLARSIVERAELATGNGPPKQMQWQRNAAIFRMIDAITRHVPPQDVERLLTLTIDAFENVTPENVWITMRDVDRKLLKLKLPPVPREDLCQMMRDCVEILKKDPLTDSKQLRKFIRHEAYPIRGALDVIRTIDDKFRVTRKVVVRFVLRQVCRFISLDEEAYDDLHKTMASRSFGVSNVMYSRVNAAIDAVQQQWGLVFDPSPHELLVDIEHRLGNGEVSLYFAEYLVQEDRGMRDDIFQRFTRLCDKLDSGRYTFWEAIRKIPADVYDEVNRRIEYLAELFPDRAEELSRFVVDPQITACVCDTVQEVLKPVFEEVEQRYRDAIGYESLDDVTLDIRQKSMEEHTIMDDAVKRKLMDEALRRAFLLVRYFEGVSDPTAVKSLLKEKLLVQLFEYQVVEHYMKARPDEYRFEIITGSVDEDVEADGSISIDTDGVDMEEGRYEDRRSDRTGDIANANSMQLTRWYFRENAEDAVPDSDPEPLPPTECNEVEVEVLVDEGGVL